MIQVNDLELHYRDGFCLRVPELSIQAGAKVALIGPSGAGKSTLLNIIAGVIQPTKGQVRVAHQELGQLTDNQRRAWRARHIGFVFQEFELLEYLTAGENIMLPISLNLVGWTSHDVRMHKQSQREHLSQLALAVGISEKLNSLPHQLSHGERQRVALCRALIHRPHLLLADEPTGSLDPHTAHDAMQLLLQQSQHAQATLLVVTHDHRHLDCFDRVLQLPME